MARWQIIVVAALALAGAYILLDGYDRKGEILGAIIPGYYFSRDMPDPYYLELKPADVHNPDDVIRYAGSIMGRASDLDIFERAAYYEWYFKSHGFDVSFAYDEDFAGTGKDHLWLLVKNQKGEVIEVDPSFSAVGGRSMVPLDPVYTRYDREFIDIFEAIDGLGAHRLAWWKDEKASMVREENVLLLEKERAQRMAEA
ncbi:hypothetical protein [Candidatus Methanocrinis natronophilus]|uniref:Uncharacterized protein n=1 Tax=Candidatus Methanocrinis natronophilus TaxID=3033396 RepID=A0ABT5X8L4_9EURY|nr:hypothetical protein [Candidatus Methanocrinis natronophilus]MDF0591045.1 hypothetical protein [Candidatus Methanocrinis natronophilus]